MNVRLFVVTMLVLTATFTVALAASPEDSPLFADDSSSVSVTDSSTAQRVAIEAVVSEFAAEGKRLEDRYEYPDEGQPSLKVYKKTGKANCKALAKRFVELCWRRGVQAEFLSLKDRESGSQHRITFVRLGGRVWCQSLTRVRAFNSEGEAIGWVPETIPESFLSTAFRTGRSGIGFNDSTTKDYYILQRWFPTQEELD